MTRRSDGGSRSDGTAGRDPHRTVAEYPDPSRTGAWRSLARVMANEPVGTMVRLSLAIPGWRAATPGQFALLQAEPSRCFLARALSVSDEADGRVSFLVAPVGDGTRELCALGVGDHVWVLGPLGRGFDVDALIVGPGRAVIVAGGAGVAPFPLLLSHMPARYGVSSREPSADRSGYPPAGPEVLVLLGFRDDAQSRAALPVEEAAAGLDQAGWRCRLEIAVEDGSRGPAELVTDLLRRHLRPGDRVAVCGTDAMSRAVWDVCAATRDVDAWFSLETNMACGVGSCHGCLITLADGLGARVCHDGPVFTGREVFGA